jgi:hypothetical protein
MIKSRSNAFRAAAIALIHAYDIHSGSHAFCRDAQHILRFAGSLQAMHHHDCQRIPTIGLPVAVTQDFHPRLNLNQALLGWGQNNSSR